MRDVNATVFLSGMFFLIRIYAKGTILYQDDIVIHRFKIFEAFHLRKSLFTADGNFCIWQCVTYEKLQYFSIFY